MIDELEQDKLRCLCNAKAIHGYTLKYAYFVYKVNLILALDLENRYFLNEKDVLQFLFIYLIDPSE